MIQKQIIYTNSTYNIYKFVTICKKYCTFCIHNTWLFFSLFIAGIIVYAERADKIIDLNCIEKSLTLDIYATCFSNVISAYEQLGENETYDLIYQK